MKILKVKDLEYVLSIGSLDTDVLLRGKIRELIRAKYLELENAGSKGQGPDGAYQLCWYKEGV